MRHDQLTDEQKHTFRRLGTELFGRHRFAFIEASNKGHLRYLRPYPVARWFEHYMAVEIHFCENSPEFMAFAQRHVGDREAFLVTRSDTDEAGMEKTLRTVQRNLIEYGGRVVDAWSHPAKSVKVEDRLSRAEGERDDAVAACRYALEWLDKHLAREGAADTKLTGYADSLKHRLTRCAALAGEGDRSEPPDLDTGGFA